MDAKFSPKVKDVIAFSREEAVRLGHDYIDACHLLLGLIREGDGQAIKTLRNLGVPLDKLKAAVEDSMRNSVEKSGLQADQIPLTKQAEKILKITFLEAKIFKSNCCPISNFSKTLNSNSCTFGINTFNAQRFNC